MLPSIEYICNSQILSNFLVFLVIFSRVCAGYQIEKRRQGGDWEKVNDFPITGENATVSDLDEGKEYEFRIAAITGAGVGEYSLNTAPVKVCEKKGLIRFLIFSYIRCLIHVVCRTDCLME